MIEEEVLGKIGVENSNQLSLIFFLWFLIRNPFCGWQMDCWHSCAAFLSAVSANSVVLWLRNDRILFWLINYASSHSHTHQKESEVSDFGFIGFAGSSPLLSFSPSLPPPLLNHLLPLCCLLLFISISKLGRLFIKIIRLLLCNVFRVNTYKMSKSFSRRKLSYYCIILREAKYIQLSQK